MAGPLTAYLADPPPDVAPGQWSHAQLPRQDRAGARGRRAATGLVLFPARFQTDDEDFARLSAIVAQAAGTLVRDAASARFREALAGLGLPMMDTLDALRAARGARAVLPADLHLTPAATRW